MKDLVVLAADKDLKMGLDALFERHQALGIRPILWDVFIHPEHDPACARRGVEFLENFVTRYQHALLIFDYHGCGLEHCVTPEQLKKQLDEKLKNGPWGLKARTIILVPELESWVWSDSPQVDNALRWQEKNLTLRQWLRRNNWLQDETDKPQQPKEALDAALRHTAQSHSASLFKRLAEKVSVKRCNDPSFVCLCHTLREWFPLA